MRKLMAAALSVLLMAATIVPAWGQYQNRRNDQRYGRNSTFYQGAYRGGRNGDYGYDRDGRYRDYDRRNHEGGIGPGKGALIGGAGGAVLGALFGGGAKGALIGGAAGAGIGAVIGEAHQKNDRHRR